MLSFLVLVTMVILFFNFSYCLLSTSFYIIAISAKFKFLIKPKGLTLNMKYDVDGTVEFKSISNHITNPWHV